MEKISMLYASYNKITGSIPNTICSLVELTFLNLSNNEISGKLPAEFGNLVKLQVCILGKITRLIMLSFQ